MIREFKFLDKEQQDLFKEYETLNQEIKAKESALKSLKEQIFNDFDGQEIVSNENNFKIKVTKTLTTRRTLDVEELLKYISEEDLEKCYTTTTTITKRITFGTIKKVEEQENDEARKS